MNRKEIELNLEYSTIKEILDYIELNIFPVKALILKDKDLIPGTIILLNGKNIVHLKGFDTVVKSGDNVDFFPPAAGG